MGYWFCNGQKWLDCQHCLFNTSFSLSPLQS